MSKYYRRNGDPVVGDDVLAWAREFETTDRRVARTNIFDGADPARQVDVSTVWLGLDHNWGDGPPLIFETMTFGDSWDGEDCERYTTEAEARAGHTSMVVRVAAVMTDPIVADVDDPTVDGAS